MSNQYRKLGLMIATATVVMFGLMYLNTYALDHVFFSETRAYITLVMGAVMAIVMLAFMRDMYPRRLRTSANARAARLTTGASAAGPRPIARTILRFHCLASAWPTPAQSSGPPRPVRCMRGLGGVVVPRARDRYSSLIRERDCLDRH